MKRAKLLLVDDDRHILDSMGSWLQSQGYDLDRAATQEEAVGRITQSPYDLVLADVRLGNGDGFNVLAHARKVRPQTAVVLMTGYATVETGIEALRAGA